MATDKLTVIDQTGELVPYSPLEAAGQAANAAASEGVFARYRSEKSERTAAEQRLACNQFAAFLGSAGVPVDAGELYESPEAWRGVTWGLVLAFRESMRRAGYAVGTINARVSHIRVLVQLANKAGAIEDGEAARIRGIEGYSKKTAPRVDENREKAGIPVRIGAKKAEPVTLTNDQVDALFEQCGDGGQGRRDRLMLHLFVDGGLRVSETAALTVSDVRVVRADDGAPVVGVVDVFRPKVQGTKHEYGILRASNGFLRALVSYLDNDALPIGPLLRRSVKGGALTAGGMTTRRISARVKTLGRRAGIDGLSAHDLRHYSANRDADRERQLPYMLSKFGWNSPATALHYLDQPDAVDVG